MQHPLQFVFSTAVDIRIYTLLSISRVALHRDSLFYDYRPGTQCALEYYAIFLQM